MVEKTGFSERDICTKFITPALEKAGWNKASQFLEEVSFTDGRIFVRGKMTTRGTGKRADYILYYKPNISFVFSSNGDGFVFHDPTAPDQALESELFLDEYMCYE